MVTGMNNCYRVAKEVTSLLRLFKVASSGLQMMKYFSHRHKLQRFETYIYIDLVKEEYATALPSVEQAIMEQTQTIRKDFGISVPNNFCQKSREFCKQLEHSLASKRSGKLRKLFLL